QAPATLQIRVQVAPVAAFLPPAPAPKDSSIASVVYNMPRDVLSMSLSEEIRPLRPGDKAFLPPGAGVADETLKTMTIVLRWLGAGELQRTGGRLLISPIRRGGLRRRNCRGDHACATFGLPGSVAYLPCGLAHQIRHQIRIADHDGRALYLHRFGGHAHHAAG